ncbi:hypothetical protein GPU89_29015 [Burkholderia cepacia]|nr:hypothetical protein [Burkholderia cepacia]
MAFGEEIDSFISTKAQASAAAKSYTGAVERAASDLANRQQRQQQLEKVLSGIFKFLVPRYLVFRALYLQHKKHLL